MRYSQKRAEKVEPALKNKLVRAWNRQAGLNSLARVSIAKRTGTLWDTLADKSFRWLFPWPSERYPGIYRGSMEVVAGRVTWAAVKHWRTGRKNMPAWARDVLADRIEARCRAGLEIVAELRAYTPPERKPSGFVVVDPETKQRRGALGR